MIARPRLIPLDQNVRMRPDIVNVALLDEIANGIRSLLDLAKASMPRGGLVPMSISVSGPDTVRERIDPPWCSMVIINDGPDQVEFTMNSIGNRFSALRANEIIPVDMKQPIIKLLWIRSVVGGTATVRLYGVT